LGAFALNALSKPRAPAESAAPSSSAAPPASKWLVDLRAGQALAKAEHKDLLIEFTRPLSLNRALSSKKTASTTVLDSNAFLRPVGSAFVLLRMNLTPDAPPEQLARVLAWATRLGVTKFPTFVLLDSEGIPYARSEFVSQAAIAYCSEIQRLRRVRDRRDRELVRADATTGLERARHLDAVLKAVGPLADTEYSALEQHVTELDSQNAAGLRAKYDAAVMHHKLDRAVREEVYPLVDRGEYLEAISRLDQLIDDAEPSRSQRQLLMAFKGQMYFGLRDQPTAAKLLDEAIALDPNSESGRRIQVAKLQLASLPEAKPRKASATAKGL
jgi:tetratricopeptide (TPR) repeat protein